MFHEFTAHPGLATVLLFVYGCFVLWLLDAPAAPVATATSAPAPTVKLTPVITLRPTVELIEAPAVFDLPITADLEAPATADRPAWAEMGTKALIVECRAAGIRYSSFVDPETAKRRMMRKAEMIAALASTVQVA